MRWLVLVFAMRLAACTPPAVKAEAKSSATFTIETLDLEDGAVSVELPVFHFDDPAVNAALAAIVARDVEREKASVRRMRANFADPTAVSLHFSCAPTIALPRLVSIRCWEHVFLGPGMDNPGVGTRHTIALDPGRPAVEVALADMFVRERGMDRFVAKVVDALAARDSCRTPLEPERVARAIRGFVVDERELAVYLDMSALDCGIVNEDFSFAWTDLDSILDPTGPHARLAARPATVR